jgi:hypothetical protein
LETVDIRSGAVQVYSQEDLVRIARQEEQP